MTLAHMSAPSRVVEGAGRRCHMRDAALPRYRCLAKTPAEEGGRWSKGLQNTRGAGDSLRGFPRPGQLPLTLPTPWLHPSTDRDVGFAVPPAPSELFLLLPKIQGELSGRRTPLPFPETLRFHHREVLLGTFQAFP